MMPSPVPRLAAHGVEMPVIGLGTAGLAEPVGEIVATALRAGYQHLDAARKYGTEEGVGEGIRVAGIPREQLFITSKVSHENLHTADFARSVEQSLNALGVSYLDLLLVHWPNPQIPLAEPLAAPIPRSSNPARIAQNIDVFDFILTDDEMKRIAALKRPDGRIANPAGRAPKWD